MESWGPRGVFALTAAFPLAVSAAALLIDEQPAAAGLRIKADRDYLRARSSASAATARACMRPP